MILHNRQSLRLRTYDYACEGVYFVTICAQHRNPLFGEILAGKMHLNRAGEMLYAVWNVLPQRFQNVHLDEYVVMPDHFHGIFHVGAPLVGAQCSVGDIVGAFKSLTTNEYISGINHHHWPAFNTKLWQRNYYERIIRNNVELHAVRRYIAENPSNWHM